MSRRPLTSRDWFGKSVAGLVLGFTLALGCAGLFKQAMGIRDAFFSTPGQFSMWLMSPVWALTVSLVFLFRTPLRAWLSLVAINLVVWLPVALTGGLAT